MLERYVPKQVQDSLLNSLRYKMQSREIRKKFIDFFKNRQHQVVSSSSVVPHEDPTLLFNNAGMNQFKDVFLGKSERDYKRAVSCQKSIRVGGKHNDLENVGHTRRHLTFFEMLGNFSFGDYFKEDAIDFAWKASLEVFGFSPEKIWVSVFRDDDEAYEIWKQHLPESRIVRMDEKDNFWSMGETGPCGPCSELLFDLGPSYGEAPSPLQDHSGERYLEFWNLVFMQYQRRIDKSLETLPEPCIDTGAGLERIVQLSMGVENVFETDVLKTIISSIEQKSSQAYLYNKAAFHVIADHLRSLSFAITDGAQPGNIERGYVLRKILRRAVRYGRSLGFEKPFLSSLLPQLIQCMGSDYPQLIEAQDRIAEILEKEEESFLKTLQRGGNLLTQVIKSAKGEKRTISGDEAFKLKDTYGFPYEEMELIAKDSHLQIDHKRYLELEEQAKITSQKNQKKEKVLVEEHIFNEHIEKFGKSEYIDEGSVKADVSAIVVDGQFVDEIQEGQKAGIISQKSPFYAEKGGQIGDKGTIHDSSTHFIVADTQNPFPGLICHFGTLKSGKIKLGQKLEFSIDNKRRFNIAKNHSATHLLHYALQKVLGPHIRQAGSLVETDRLRFDFSHHKGLSLHELREIEDIVNEAIRKNFPRKIFEIDYQEAQKRPEIKQFFGDKYGKNVRVVDLGICQELCGGTHVEMLGQIGYFRIQKESSIAAGIRRIEAICGQFAENFSRKSDDLLLKIAADLKTPLAKIEDKIQNLMEEKKTLNEELKEIKKSNERQEIQNLKTKIEMVKGIPFLASEVGVKAEDLRRFTLDLSDAIGPCVLFLASKSQQKCQLIAKVSDNYQEKGIRANDIIVFASSIVDGRGGGKADIALAGGKAPEKLPQAIKETRQWFEALCKTL